MVILINMNTGHTENKVTYISDEDAALKELLKKYYVSAIMK